MGSHGQSGKERRSPSTTPGCHSHTHEPKSVLPPSGGHEMRSPASSTAPTGPEPLDDDLIAEVRYTIRRNESEQKRLRQMILDLNEAGVTQRELARRIGVPLGTLTHWIRTAKADRGDPPRRR
ncbi:MULTISPECIES: helix-turn-helix domain-containing protein [Curtobacterium]|uniref:helix-turn-helix domain-containing protein n=1 Tax=Curtobacterium TaxID=2034 RepID=UPI0034DB476B